jgi:TolB-like protein/class 3 adenylate cyclase/Tfp pilus assembly protein PilF
MMRRQVGMERKLTAILCADVYGYSRLMGGDEEATLVTLTAHRKIIDNLIEQHHGRFVNSAGDSVLAEFASVVDAVNCAMDTQTALGAENAKLQPERRMEFRIGVNLGDVMVEGDQIYGDGINVAARLENLADPGGICISGKVHEEIRSKLPLGYEDLGEQTVKNIAHPVHTWRVLPDATTSHRKTRRIPRRYWHAGVFSFAGLAIIAGTIVIVQHLSLRPQSTHASIPSLSPAAIPPMQTPALPFPDKPSIAVLPFANVSGDPSQEYFSDGVTDQVINDLSKLPGLFVIDRNSAFTYKGKPVKVQAVSRELGVQLVLEGSARKTSDGVRIAVQLVDATTGANLWAERFDRPLRDIFAVQDEIVQKIVTTLDLEFKLGERGIPAGVRMQGTDNLEAFDDVLRGAWYGWSMTQEGNAKARTMYEKAIELDPKYADAYVDLGSTYFADAWNGWMESSKASPVEAHPDVVKSQQRALERASEMVQKAIALDDSLPGAYQLLSQLDIYKGHYEQSIADAQRAIALDSNSASGYFALAMDQGFALKPEDAIKSANKAMRLDPRNRDLYLSVVAWSYSHMGRYAEAVSLIKQSLARYPNSFGDHWILGVAYVELGRMDEARAEVAELMRINPHLTLEGTKRSEEHGVGYPLKDRVLAERELADLGKAGLK